MEATRLSPRRPNIAPAKSLRLKPTPSEIMRFMRKVKVGKKLFRGSPCWLWTAHCDGKGYGQFGINGKVMWAHRVAFAIFRGSIPALKQIDHCCRNPSCVNPWHCCKKTQAKNYAEANRRRAVDISDLPI